MKNFIKNHKFISLIIILILIIGGYYGYKAWKGTSVQTQYVLSPVTRDTIIATVSGSGQIAVSNEVTLTSKASGNVLSVPVKNGQEVKAGTLLAKLDTTDAAKTVRNAQNDLDSARLALEKMQRGVRPEEAANTLASVQSAQQNLKNSQDDLVNVQNKSDQDLTNVYVDAKNTLQDAYDKTDDILNNQLNNIFVNNNTNEDTHLSFIDNNPSAENDALNQRILARQALVAIKNTLSNSTGDQTSLDNALISINGQLQTVQNFLIRLSDVTQAGIVTASVSQSTINGYESTISSARSTINTVINNINAQEQTIASQKITNKDNITSAQTQIANAQNSLTQSQNSLALQKAGNDPLDIQNEKISVTAKENALRDAEETYADYSIKAPFDGVVASMSVIKGDSVSTGATIATFITKQQIAQISLNEVDVAKIKVGQKVTMTFDAVDGLSISGEVAQIDTIGTVTQGVVTYNVKINLDTQDSRVRPGMTVNADIITDVEQNVLTVPSGAVKTKGTNSYVEMIDNPITIASSSSVTSLTAPRQQVVQIGISDDTNTQIISGLNEGDEIVTQTITTAITKATTPTSASSLLGGSAGRAAGGATGAAAGGAYRSLGH